MPAFHQTLICYRWWWHLWVGQCLVTQLHLILCSPMGWSPPGSSVLVDSPGKNTGVGFHALLQRIFPIRDRMQVPCIAGRFFTTWDTRQAWWHRCCDAIFIQHVLEVVYQFLAPYNYHKALTHCNKCDFSRATTRPVQAMIIFRRRF